MAWDVTCSDTLATSNLSGSVSVVGHAAEHAANHKKQEYNQLAVSHTFIPLAIETLGAINEEGIALLHSLGGRWITTTGDKRERMFLYLRLSMAVQRGNISCFSGSLPKDQLLNL